MNSWPTQPIPKADNVLFNKLDRRPEGPARTAPSAQTNAYVPYATATAPDGKPFKIGCAYDPYDTTEYVVQPFEMMDWPASSYSPENKTFITCGVSDRATAFKQIPRASQVVGAFGGYGVGSPRRGRHVDLQHRQLLRAEGGDGQADAGTSTGRPRATAAR